MKLKLSLFITLILSLLIATGCAVNVDLDKDESSKISEVSQKEIQVSDGKKICQKKGFSFSHPEKYVCDDKGLWTEEGYERHVNPPEACDTCHIPYLEVKAGATNKNLEQYIISDFDLPGDTLEEMSQNTSIPHSEVTIGNYDFVQITVRDLHTVTGYYTKHNNTVVAFRTYWDKGDAEEIKEIISTLKFE